jgi:hypothetical protein
MILPGNGGDRQGVERRSERGGTDVFLLRREAVGRGTASEAGGGGSGNPSVPDYVGATSPSLRDREDLSTPPIVIPAKA